MLALLLVGVFMGIGASEALALSPSVGSKAASNVDYSTATLNGTVNPNGLETKTYFEYGLTTSYGSKTAEVGVGAGSSALEKAQAVTGLTPNTTYHYRVVATNADGTSLGGDRTFYVGWNTQTTATPSTAGAFHGVSCFSATGCTAVGDWEGGQMIAQRWNGSEWKSQTLVKPAGAIDVRVNGVSCPSSSVCFGVGSYMNSSGKWVTLAESWNGSEWKLQTSPNPAATGARLDSVSCSSTSECTAVGNSWESGPPEVAKTLALRWDGTEWKIQTTPNPVSNSPSLTSVSCPSSAFCMATGFYYDSGTSAYAPLSERWDGSEWVIKSPVKPGGATMSWLYGVSCTSSTACTAVGDKEISAMTHQHQTVAQRWNGSSWSLQTTPNPESTNLALEDVSCTSATVCMAIGNFSNAGGQSPMGLRWNGTEWALQPPPSPSATMALPFAISCVVARGCQAVGQYKNGSSVIVPLAQANWRNPSPTATTTAATGIGDTTATINGTVNPNGTETKGYFEYGKTTGYGTKTAEVNFGSGTSTVEATAGLSGLTPSTIYHFRFVANNENPETAKGADQTFTTTGPPTVNAIAAEVDKTTAGAATLKASINPNGHSTTYQFEYGTSSGSYTKTVPIPAEAVGSGTEFKLVSYKVTGLTPGTKYYYRATASNSAGKTDGPETFFTPVGPPGATTSPASGITRKCAVLQGTVQTFGLSTKYQFEYGTTISYGTKIPVTPKEVSGETASKVVEETVCGLSPKTLYHYRLVAENSLGTANGEDRTFTTIAAVTLAVKGTPLKTAAPLKVFSSNLVITTNETTIKHICAEAEFSGTVSENPGAVEAVTTPVMQNAGGAACSYWPAFGLTVKYSFPAGGITLEYTADEAGQGLAKMSDFALLGKVYSGGLLIAECEYSVKMSGTYKFNVPLELSLSGASQIVKQAGSACLYPETITGTFAVTSGGEAVEAKP